MKKDIVIPEMTDPMGRYWDQPSKDKISFSLSYAWMDKESFDALKDYSQSQPTGCYPGKMWKSIYYRKRVENRGTRIVQQGWLLRWFGDEFIKDGNAYCSNHSMHIRLNP